ncbi:hypothetical protein FQZ97_1136330 [compost metagenome]
MHAIDLAAGGAGQGDALFDQAAGALQFVRVAADQAGKIALEGDAAVFCRRAVVVAGQAQQGGKGSAGGAAVVGHAEQGQGLQRLRLPGEGRQFALDVGGQFATAAADQFGAGMGQARQVLGRDEQGLAVGVRRIGGSAVGIVRQLFQGAAHLAFGLQ